MTKQNGRNNKRYKIAIVGATGAVGQQLRMIMEDESNLKIEKLYLIGSSKSLGTKIAFQEQECIIESIEEFDFTKVDLAFFCTSNAISKKYVPIALKANAIVIDKSSEYRMQQSVPLIVPEVNGRLLLQKSAAGEGVGDGAGYGAGVGTCDETRDGAGGYGIRECAGDGITSRQLIANPNCVAIPLAIVLHACSVPIAKANVATYQAVSGLGNDALRDFMHEARQITSDVQCDAKYAFTLNECIGEVQANGFSDEENKIMNETRKILGYDFEIAVQCVRVPVFVSHCCSLFVELEEDVGTEELVENLHENGVPVYESVTPQFAQNHDGVFVSRVRKFAAKKFSMWFACNNLRKGAALNAVEIAETMLELHKDEGYGRYDTDDAKD